MNDREQLEAGRDFFQRKRGCSALLTIVMVGTLLASSLSHAQVSPGDRETARRLLRDGDWQTEVKNFERALASYQAAHELMNLPSTGMAVVHTLQSLGRLVEARDLAERIVRMPRTEDESEVIAEARQEAVRVGRQLAERIPTVEVRVQPPSTDVQVAVDGVTLVGASARMPRAVDPGEHEVSVVAPDGRKQQQRVVVADGDRRVVNILLPASSPVVPAAEPSRPPSEPASPVGEPTQPLPAAAYIGFSVAALGLGVGSVTGLISWSRTRDIESSCPGMVCECPTEACRDDRQAKIDSARAYATTSNIAFGVGAVGLGAGLAAWALGGSDTSSSTAGRIHPSISPNSVALSGAF